MRRHSPRRQQRPKCLRMPLRPHGCAHNGIARRRRGGNNTAHLECDQEITALLVIDPYNDFISEGGKVWDRLKTVAEANNCVPHMLQVLTAARKAGLRVFWNGYLPWGVLTFGLGGFVQHQDRPWFGHNRCLWYAQGCPLGRQPCPPVVARVVEQPLP